MKYNYAVWNWALTERGEVDGIGKENGNELKTVYRNLVLMTSRLQRNAFSWRLERETNWKTRKSKEISRNKDAEVQTGIVTVKKVVTLLVFLLRKIHWSGRRGWRNTGRKINDDVHRHDESEKRWSWRKWRWNAWWVALKENSLT